MTIELPPRTSISDVVGIIGISLGGAVIWHGVIWFWLRGLVASVIRRHTGAKETPVVSDAQLAVARRFHRSGFSLFLSWIPTGLHALGGIACSLIRDAGYLIFPWPILASSILFALGYSLTFSIRLRRLQKLLFSQPPSSEARQ